MLPRISALAIALPWQKQDSSLWACATTPYGILQFIPNHLLNSLQRLFGICQVLVRYVTPFEVGCVSERCVHQFRINHGFGKPNNRAWCYAAACPWSAPWTFLCSVSSQIDSFQLLGAVLWYAFDMLDQFSLDKKQKTCFHQFVNILCLKFCLIILIRHKTTLGFPFE